MYANTRRQRPAGISRKQKCMYACTIVTAYYKIPSKCSSEIYMKWISNLLQFKHPIVFFTSEDLVPSFRALRGDLPITFIVAPFDNIYMWETYKKEWIQQQTSDPEPYHSPELYAVWANKAVWLEDAAIKNPYRTENFMWVDAGGFRIDEDQHLYIEHFPKLRRFSKRKMLFSLVYKFKESDYKRENSIIGNFTKVEGDFRDRIVGGFFGGGLEACRVWRKAYESMLLRYFVKGYFAGKDQPIMASTLLDDPSLGDILEPTIPDTQYGDIKHWLFLPRFLSDIQLKRKLFVINPHL